ncbi:MAG: hypothetical protein KC591_11135, partial [Gemmatimonadetes bacterium]|nr:hypothetical protein [Gemmatimonadota bacterium]
FQIDCGTPLPLVVSTNTEVEAALFVTLVETSPGLQYTISMPFDFATGTPTGLTVQLPSDIGIDLEVTTPTGVLTCTLDGDRAGGPGIVRQRGTVRFEEAGNVTFVQEVALDYGFDDAASPRFEPYPSGTYEIGSFGGFGFDRGPGIPVDVSFDGEGGLTYSFEGMSCTADMPTFSNPCGDN